MSTCVKKIIRFDYFTKMLFLVTVVVLLLMIAIIAVGESTGLGIIIPGVIILIALIVYRTIQIKKVLDRIKDNTVKGTVLGTMRNNGNFYVSFSYEFEGETYKKRVGLLIGPLLKIKLAKLETVDLVVDNLNPKNAYMSVLYYK